MAPIHTLALTVHPAAELFPLLSGLEAEALAKDIREFGQHQPITIYQGQILDGRNRYEACLRLGIEPRTTEYIGADPVGFVISMNLMRRHLDESQRAMVAARAADMRSGARTDLAPIGGRSQADAARLLNVGERSVERAAKVMSTGVPELAAAVDAGEIAVSTAALIAEEPADVQQEIVAKGEKEIIAAARRIRERKSGERRAQRIVLLEQAARGNVPLDLPSRAAVVLADPPWRYATPISDGRRIENHYPTMSLDEICAVPISNVITEDCLLCLWATNPLLLEALKVIEAWGFTYRANLVWVKDKIGMGKRVRQRHELLLLATRGSFPAPGPAEMPESVIEAPRTEHSAKPVEAYEIIERQYPSLPKLELFARSSRAGWMQWGNQLGVHAGAEAPRAPAHPEDPV